jgi:hypothetical protein
MMQKNPQYAKEHAALGIAMSRGIIGAAAENNKRWTEKTAQLLQKYGARVNESYNPEYDDEAGMADNNLETLERAVQGIDDLIDSGDNLPEWCQEKIAVAKSMLVTVWDYMKSEENTEPSVAEGDKIGNMDADKFDDAMTRLKKLAGAGPMKTVYDPNTRRYKNVPIAQQPGDKK